MAVNILTDEQKETVADIMEKHWGGHMQTGHVAPDSISLWTKMGPQEPAIEHIIFPDGRVTVNGIDWDGRTH